MPNTKSAQKRQRSNVAKAQRNRDAKSRVRTLEKKFRTIAAGDDKAAAVEAHRLAVSALDKACKKGVLARSTVNRKKSRLTKALAAGA